MRAARTLLGWLYCLSVVLLPYLHILFDAHGMEDPVSTACSGHTHDHDHPPEGENPESHHESCLLCKFLAAENDTPERAPDLRSDLGMVFLQVSGDEACAFIQPRTHHARAPPFKTV